MERTKNSTKEINKSKTESARREDSAQLKAFLEPMDYAHRLSAMVRIADACMVPPERVRRWRSGYNRVPPIMKKTINEEFGREIFKL